MSGTSKQAPWVVGQGAGVVGHKQAPARRAPVWCRSEGDGVAQSEGFGVARSSAWMTPSGEVRVVAVNPSERQRWRAGVM
jgi:hypothetical protein